MLVCIVVWPYSQQLTTPIVYIANLYSCSRAWKCNKIGSRRRKVRRRRRRSTSSSSSISFFSMLLLQLPSFPLLHFLKTGHVHPQAVPP